MKERNLVTEKRKECSGTPSESVNVAAIREDLVVDVEKVETAAVRVRKEVHEETVDVPLTLKSEAVEIRRVPVNKPVEQEFGPRQEGDTLVIPVFEYVPVTEIRLMLKEEVHVTKHSRSTAVTKSVEVIKQEVVVERRDGPDGEWLTQK